MPRSIAHALVGLTLFASASAAQTGFVRSIGTGLAGTLARVPLLGIGTCPRLGQVLPITISNGPSNALAFLVFSVRPTSLPLFGGTLYVGPPFVDTRSLFLSGSGAPVAPGFGRLDFAVPNDPAIVGVSIFGQAAVRDPGATRGWSLTQAVEIQVQ